ncbi:cytochrome P450 [Mycena olivaceomarginata]|nr:cytochrome P450 [Mycena olivaceomarginata]
MVHEGYITRAGPIFRVPLFTHWTHVVSGPGSTREIGAARDADLSLDDAIDEIIQTDYTMGAALRNNTYHVGVVHVWDEIMCAFEDVLSLKGTGANRLFVGLPLCRSPEWIELNIRYTIDTAVAGQLIRMLPRSSDQMICSILGPLFTSRKRNLRQAEKLLGPILQERFNNHDSRGSNSDLVTWLLDASPPDGRTVPAIAERILAVNFGAIHTSSMVVATDGWTKAAIGRMHKVDSFLRESQRMNGLGIRQRGAGSLFMHSVITTSMDYLAFGHGRHACPGRFFAAMELKAMLAHVIINYDVKFESSTMRPPNQCIGAAYIPNRTAKVWFRRRSEGLDSHQQ